MSSENGSVCICITKKDGSACMQLWLTFFHLSDLVSSDGTVWPFLIKKRNDSNKIKNSRKPDKI